MKLNKDQINLFFSMASDKGLPISFCFKDTKGDHELFCSLIRKHFGKSISDLILLDETLVGIPLIINGTPWEELIARWRLGLY
jgi:hypothetical protein